MIYLSLLGIFLCLLRSFRNGSRVLAAVLFNDNPVTGNSFDYYAGLFHNLNMRLDWPVLKPGRNQTDPLPFRRSLSNFRIYSREPTVAYPAVLRECCTYQKAHPQMFGPNLALKTSVDDQKKGSTLKAGRTPATFGSANRDVPLGGRG